jgi:hypothetical protein
VVLDDVLVESVGSELAFGRGELKLLAGHEPQQVTLPAAVGTIALHDLPELAVDFKGDATAMATALVDHRLPPSVDRDAPSFNPTSMEKGSTPSRQPTLTR